MPVTGRGLTIVVMPGRRQGSIGDGSTKAIARDGDGRDARALYPARAVLPVAESPAVQLDRLGEELPGGLFRLVVEALDFKLSDRGSRWRVTASIARSAASLQLGWWYGQAAPAAQTGVPERRARPRRA
jgi:hypothetical protein